MGQMALVAGRVLSASERSGTTEAKGDQPARDWHFRSVKVLIPNFGTCDVSIPDDVREMPERGQDVAYVVEFNPKGYATMLDYFDPNSLKVVKAA